MSHKYGLTTWLENYGHWGFPGEFLQYGGQSDEIGGEFWSEGSLGDIENRAASSCGHIYGKNKISAESFTAGGGGYHRYPAMMKQRGDRFFTEGINNTLLHLYISQPYEDREPGVNATFGNEFNRKNTWFPQLDLFIKYVKRVNFMLQQGLNVADAAYFIGEDTPKMTGVTDPALPKGYQFDYINAEVIERDMTVANGLLTLPHGTQYRILVLPKLETMRPQLLDKIARLIEQGAVVLGPAPRRSPSYEELSRCRTGRSAARPTHSGRRSTGGRLRPHRQGNADRRTDDAAGHGADRLRPRLPHGRRRSGALLPPHGGRHRRSTSSPIRAANRSARPPNSASKTCSPKHGTPSTARCALCRHSPRHPTECGFR